MEISETLLTAIKKYVEQLQAYSDNKFKTDYPSSWALNQQPTYSYETGKKWVKIIKKAPGDCSPFCFIDPANGDIYKPETFSRPAKGVRTNIYNESLPLEAGQLYRYR